MDKAEKWAFSLAGLMLVIFMLAIIIGSNATGVHIPGAEKKVQPFSKDTLFQVGPEEYELHMIARMWVYQPSTITLPAGSTVHIYIISKDVEHGFLVKDKDVNMMVMPGEVNTETVKFEKPGTYPFLCHEYCGAGHQFMSGKFVIKQTGGMDNENQ